MTNKKTSTAEEPQALELGAMEQATTQPQHSDVNGGPTEEQRVRLTMPTPTQAKVLSTLTTVTLGRRSDAPWGRVYSNQGGTGLGGVLVTRGRGARMSLM